MLAKVSGSYFLNIARSAGMEFCKKEWRHVPPHAEAEVSKAPFLVIFEGGEDDILESELLKEMALTGKTAAQIAAGGEIQPADEKKPAAKPKKKPAAKPKKKLNAKEKRAADKAEKEAKAQALIAKAEATETDEVKAEKEAEPKDEKPAAETENK